MLEGKISGTKCMSEGSKVAIQKINCRILLNNFNNNTQSIQNLSFVEKGKMYFVFCHVKKKK